MTDFTDVVADALEAFARDKAAQEETLKEEAKVEIKAPEAVAGEGEVLASSLLGAVPRKMTDFPLPAPGNWDFNKSMSGFVPTFDPDYVPQVEEAALLLMGLRDNDRIMITGPTGSGKSSLVRWCAAALKIPFLRINMTGDTESAELFGTIGVEDGATVWHDGPVTEMVKNGGVLLVDEWDMMPAEISMGLQNLIEEGGWLYLKEKPGSSEERTIKPHPGFRIIFAGNSVGNGDESGKHAGIQPQNTATIDRMSLTIQLHYLSKQHEVKVITAKTGIDNKIASRMVEVAQLIRVGYGKSELALTMSPRTLINWARKTLAVGDLTTAFVMAYSAKLVTHQRTAAEALLVKVFPKDRL